jgi:hypothetical protein
MSDLHVEFSPAIEVGNGASTPGEGDQQDQGLEVLEVVEMELVYQGCKEGLDFFGELDDLKHTGNLLWVHCVFNSPIEEIVFFVERKSHPIAPSTRKSQST